jgi:hypothetical protein
VSPRRLLHYNGLVLRRYATRYPSEQTARHLKAISAIAGALERRGYASVTLNCPSSVTDVRPAGCEVLNPDFESFAPYARGQRDVEATLRAALATPRPTLVEVILEDSAVLHLDRAKGLARRALPVETLRRLRRRVRGSK